MDGAGPLRRFWNITLPMLSPVLFFNVLLETIHAFQVFSSAYVVSGSHVRARRRHPRLHLLPLPEGLQGVPDGLRLRDGLDAAGRGRRW